MVRRNYFSDVTSLLFGRDLLLLVNNTRISILSPKSLLLSRQAYVLICGGLRYERKLASYLNIAAGHGYIMQYMVATNRMYNLFQQAFMAVNYLTLGLRPRDSGGSLP